MAQTNVPAKAKQDTLALALEKGIEKFRQVAPKYMNVERLTRLMLAARSRNPKIAKCSVESVLLFTMRCAETGLEPIGPGGAWPVPFENRKNNTCELTFIPDYRGLIGLAKKNGDVQDVLYYPVYANDEFELEYGMNPNVIHKPFIGKERGELEGVYAIVVTPEGSKIPTWMNKDDIDSIRSRSKASGFGPWKTDYEAMALKTVIRRALKPFARSPQLQTAMEYDNEATGIDLDPTAGKPEIEVAPEVKITDDPPVTQPPTEKIVPPKKQEPEPDSLPEPSEEPEPEQEPEPEEVTADQRKRNAEEIEKLRIALGYDEEMILNFEKIYGTELLAFLRRKHQEKQNRKSKKS